jgi:hypothetical protein
MRIQVNPDPDPQHCPGVGQLFLKGGTTRTVRTVRISMAGSTEFKTRKSATELQPDINAEAIPGPDSPAANSGASPQAPPPVGEVPCRELDGGQGEVPGQQVGGEEAGLLLPHLHQLIMHRDTAQQLHSYTEKGQVSDKENK